MAQIDYNEISNTKVPGCYCEIDNSLASAGLSGKPSVGLLIGQALDGTLGKNTLSGVISDADQLIALAGEGSELHRMAKAWKEKNTANKLYVIAPDQSEGVAAVYKLTLTAEDVKAGMVNLMIAGREVRLTVNEGDEVADITAALIEKINANKQIPATAAEVSDKPAELTLTAKHKGEAGNYIDIRFDYYEGEETAAGVKASVTQETKGSGNVSLAATIAATGDGYFTDIVTSYTDAANVRLLKTELSRRYNAMVCNESVVYYTLKGTLNEMLTGVDGVNHQCVSPIMDYKSPNMPEERAARFAAIAAYEFQKDPARQLSTLVLDGDLPAKEELTADERNMLLEAGISTLVTNASEQTAIEREVTSYRYNDRGVANDSYFDLPTVKTLIYLRYSYRDRILNKYGRYKLADDGYDVQPGQAIVTPSILTAEVIALAEDWQAAGLVEDISAFKESIISMIDSSDKNRVNQLFQPNIMNNLRLVAGKLQYIS